MKDIFDHITDEYLKEASSPLRLQPDYGSHFAEDDDLMADDFDMMADELEADDMDLMADEFEASTRRRASHREPAYMSRQNLRQMLDQIVSICENLGDMELEGWVEDKISHAHAALQDVSRYMAYGRRSGGDHHHHHHHAHDDFDHYAEMIKESSEDDYERLAGRSWTKKEWEEHLEKYPEMAYYEGAYNKGKFNPARTNKNIKKYKLEKEMAKGRFMKKKKASWR